MKKLTRAVAIRGKCLDCSGGEHREVRECHLEFCPLWPYSRRDGAVNEPRLKEWRKNHGYDDRRHTRNRAIREYCLDCCKDQPEEVRACGAEGCRLWPYRAPSCKMTPEELREWQERFYDG